MGKCFEVLMGHLDTVLCLDFQYNKLLSSGGEADKSIMLW